MDRNTEPETIRFALNVNEAAQYLGVSGYFIRKAVWDGRLTARKACGRIMISRADLEDFWQKLPQVPKLTSGWIEKRRSGTNIERLRNDEVA